MASLRKRGGILCLAAALALAGCETVGDRPMLTKDEELLRTHSDTFVVENTAGGAAVGAAIGCLLIGVLVATSRGNSGDIATGCAAGAVGGAVLGGVDGYMKAKQAQYKSNQIAITESIVADARADNARLSEAVETTRRVIDQDRQKLANLTARVDAKQITVAQARAEARVIRDNTKQVETILAGAKEKRDTYVEARSSISGANTVALDGEITRLNKEIAVLETQLSSVNTSLRVAGLG